MSSLLDNFILRYNESQRYDYLMLHELIMSCSNEIVLELKYKDFLFYCFNKPLIYINFDRKRKKFYLGFCYGKQLKDTAGIFYPEDSKWVTKWYFEDEVNLFKSREILKDLILQAIELNRINKIK